ncbi:MAG: class I SAM-dependent DNA methyltransferase [Promethearchaeota archaeon]
MTSLCELNANNLVKEFGLKSTFSQTVIQTFLEAIDTSTEKYENWQVQLSKIYGLNLNQQFSFPNKLKISKNTTIGQFVFCVQSYYALLIKFIAAEVVFRIFSSTNNSFLSLIISASNKEFIDQLKQIELGEFFDKRGIQNFPPKSSSFSWYLSILDSNLPLRRCLNELAKKLNSFDFSSFLKKPSCEDILSSIYIDLIPKQLRHKLGEYYTPTWLVYYILNQLKYFGDPKLKILDPSCGSGTFLIEIIRLIKKFAFKKLDKEEIVSLILQNVIGFDLNPLAVLAASTNYLISIYSIAPIKKARITIPVYHCDSLLSGPAIQPVDFLVGNPPWVNWAHLPLSYRQRLQYLWEDTYHLFGSGNTMKKLGGARKDLSMLFIYRSIDLYLKDSGKAGFVVPQSLFKSEAARQFRNFYLSNCLVSVGVEEVHDLLAINIFENAKNRPALIFLRKNEVTSYPVKYNVWKKNKSFSNKAKIKKEKLSEIVEIHKLLAKPIDNTNGAWVTGTKPLFDLLSRISGSSEYRARAGVYTALNGVYWVKLFKSPDKTIYLENLAKGKKNYWKVRIKITEDDLQLVYPLLRGRDIHCWTSAPSCHIIVPHTMETGMRSISEQVLETDHPQIYNFFRQFQPLIEKRPIHKRWGKRQPFYSLYDIGHYTFSPYKVVWRYIASEIKAVVISKANDPILGKKLVIPDIKLMMVPLENELEAHYLCAMLNSTFINVLVKCYAIGTQLATHVLKNIKIPKFRPNDLTHKRLALLSLDAHKNPKLRTELKNKIDNEVEQVLGLKPQEIAEIKYLYPKLAI